MNIANLLAEAAQRRPEHTALIFEEQRYTYAELDRAANRVANALQGLGLSAGDRIAIFLDSSAELVLTFLGALKAGCVPNVVNGFLAPDEVRHVVNDSGALLLVTDSGRLAQLGPVLPELCTRHTWVAGESGGVGSPPAGASERFEALDLPSRQLASLLYTSGTTGFPKGVMLSHLNILDNATQFARIHYGPHDRLLVAAPTFHCWGLINGVLGTFAAGGTAIVMRRFQTEPCLDLLESARATQFMGVPAMVGYMARSATIARRDLTNLAVVHTAAAPMPHELIGILKEEWNVRYAESYGLTEVSPVITTTSPAEHRTGSCGRAMGDTRLKVTDMEGRTLPPGEVGELWASGTAVCLGYYNRPDATAEVFMPDGWFKTGDIVRMDSDGYVYIVDRKKDMINVGGEKVYPRDVEEVLHRHPAVADAVVVGVPDPNLGEAVKAVVALKPGQRLDAGELIAHLRPLLAFYKVPRTVEFVDAVPRSASGKALRRLLR